MYHFLKRYRKPNNQKLHKCNNLKNLEQTTTCLKYYQYDYTAKIEFDSFKTKKNQEISFT